MTRATEPTHKQRRQRLDYANRLAELAVEAPDDETKQLVYNTVKAIRRRNGWTPEEKMAEILRVLQVGASTHTEIVRETQFHRDEVFELTEMLERRGLVVLRKMSVTGGAGRPALFIVPSNVP